MRALLMSVLLATLVAPAWGDPEALRAEAATAAAEGRTDDAIDRYEALLRMAPDDGAAHYQLAVLLMDGGVDLDAAAGHFQRAGELGFQPLGVGYRLSRIHARQGREEEALEQLEAIAAAGFGLIGLVEGQEDYASLEGNERYKAAVDAIRAARYPCDADPRHHAFDFWIGDWNVSNNGQHAGTNSIQPILGHCTLLEQWTDVTGGEGKSFNYYDPGRDHWRQIWISDSGSVIEFTGEARDGGIYYTAETVNPADGSVTLHRFDFTRNGDGTVRQHWQTSTDGGATFTTVWDGHYERRAGTGERP